MLLAIDTSTRKLGVGLYEPAGTVDEMIWGSEFHHTVELAPAVAITLAHANLTVDDLGAIGVAIGPGSFTALRTGLAFAKGLALQRKLPLIGIPSLDVLAASQPALKMPVAAVLEAGRARLAVGWYLYKPRGWKSFGRLELLTPEELNEKITKNTYVCGELKPKSRKLLRKNPYATVASLAGSSRRPAHLAELAWKRWRKGQIDDPGSLAPIYLSRQSAGEG